MFFNLEPRAVLMPQAARYLNPAPGTATVRELSAMWNLALLQPTRKIITFI